MKPLFGQDRGTDEVFKCQADDALATNTDGPLLGLCAAQMASGR